MECKQIPVWTSVPSDIYQQVDSASGQWIKAKRVPTPQLTILFHNVGRAIKRCFSTVISAWGLYFPPHNLLPGPPTSPSPPWWLLSSSTSGFIIILGFRQSFNAPGSSNDIDSACYSWLIAAQVHEFKVLDPHPDNYGGLDTLGHQASFTTLLKRRVSMKSKRGYQSRKKERRQLGWLSRNLFMMCVNDVNTHLACTVHAHSSTIQELQDQKPFL